MTTTHPMRPRRLILIAVVATLGLLAAACGGGRSTSADGDGSTPATGGSTSTGSGDFGTLASPCGPGTPSGAPDVGVTDTAITIGYGDDAGFPSLPGAGHEMSDAVKALISWCNEQGGINGRTVVGNYYDAKVTDVVNAMTAACQADNFFLVGQGYLLDSAQEQVRQGCGLPSVPAYGTSWPSARLVPDAAVERGGCVVESDIGVVDAQVATRWARAAGLLGAATPWETPGSAPAATSAPNAALAAAGPAASAAPAPSAASVPPAAPTALDPAADAALAGDAMDTQFDGDLL